MQSDVYSVCIAPTSSPSKTGPCRTPLCGGGYFFGLLLPLGLALLPVAIVVHGLRFFFCAKHQLFQDLQHFRLASAECSEQFDALFVHSAIEAWYGSTEAFEHFVQTVLVREIPAVTVSAGYCVLLATIPVTHGQS